ncbi:MAG: hypothetical protein ACK5AV_05355 [Alphaproteobacteria bacterium]|jgi:cell division protein ZapA (FtsZ GTPase activity inhibitor)|nr:hypothetical protein [Candidatus Jidaibacter sp.]
MSQIEITVRGLALSLEAEDEGKILDLAAKYNSRLDELAKLNKNCGDLKLSMIAGLIMEDTIDSLNQKVQNASNNNTQDIETVKVSYNEAISQIADYIDTLAYAVEKR